jgi:GNAT superfamily N-acetyltransferase
MDPGRLGTAGQLQALIQEQHCLVAAERGADHRLPFLRPGRFYGRDLIDLLYLAPLWRRQGAGRALMRAALREIFTSRLFVCTNEVECPHENPAAQRRVDFHRPAHRSG